MTVTDIVPRPRTAAPAVPPEECFQDLWDADLPAVRPELAAIEGGDLPLLYGGGRSHLLFGAGGTGKSWIAETIALSVLAADPAATVVWIDLEMTLPELVGRAKALGATRAQAARIFRQPLEGPLTAALGALRARWAARPPTLVVLDSMAQALSGAGANENDNSEVGAWWGGALTPMAKMGAQSILVLDHVAKPQPGSGLAPAARGAGAKINLISGAAWSLQTKEPFSCGQRGSVELVVAKDRHGARTVGDVAAVAVVVPGPDGSLAISLRAPEAPSGQAFRPTAAMASIAEWLARNGPANTTQIRGAMTFRPATVAAAIEALVAEGCIATTTTGREKTHTLARPFASPEPPDTSPF